MSTSSSASSIDAPEEPPGDDSGRSRRGKILLSLLAVLLLAGAGLAITLAALTDDVTAAQITVTGGTLDLVANGNEGDSDVPWTGTLTTETGVFSPGEVRSGTMELENNGDINFTALVSASGTDTSGCFGYWFHQIEPTTADLPGFGTGSDTDGATAPFNVANDDVSLPDAGADEVWEVGDTKRYELSVRMLELCDTNAASGNLSFSFQATQV